MGHFVCSLQCGFICVSLGHFVFHHVVLKRDFRALGACSIGLLDDFNVGVRNARDALLQDD